MKIGILQAGHSPQALFGPAGDYGSLFTKLLDGHGFDFEIFSVVDGVFPAGPQAADGWLITGSKHGAYEDLDWIAPLEDLIREIDAAKLPLVGICFGHQIIAQALGGKVVKFPGGWSVGRTEYMLDGKAVALNAWHQDQVIERPAAARVVGSSAFCENAMLAYGDQIWTVQAHPEFQSSFVDGLIRTRGKGVVPEAQLQAARDTLDLPNNNTDIAAHIAGFFKQKARA
ncbi:type 1 glutamine amidotransferase [Sulfitobacter sp. S190]|uniref:type 1 glutamine amidotransferase n=1 Tax=Sulfitobacter sp. S190 TaxID=2867022 RepID=UPI0021A4FDFA|nr:type 1 glutamine amidotransferase [Sulfitobacter sp. S190]UWR21449.1 type 1 glutamine amidotransferase [Sulfitobacter sp. S190]